MFKKEIDEIYELCKRVANEVPTANASFNYSIYGMSVCGLKRKEDVSLPEGKFPILRKGSSGTAVAMLQAMLGVEVDGQFGNDTYNSLKVFQKNTGVTANGTCGIDTWKRVIEHMKANTK